MSNDFTASMINGYVSGGLEDSTVRYVDNYWIDREQLECDWAPLIESVFKRSSGKVSVAQGYVVDFRQGGILFTQDEFLAFVDRAKAAGAEKFAVIEDIGQLYWRDLQDLSFFRFSYPVDVPWNEMTCSSILAQDVFERPIRCFFVVTDNGRVGKYANNDADKPYDLIFYT